MLTLRHCLAPNADEVAGEVIDGEAIIINLATGVYYSMDRVGGLIWGLIEARHSLLDIVTTIVARYDVSRERAEADVQRVASELLEQKLVVVSDAEPSPRRDQEGALPNLSYETPGLTAYRDMGDLLALDPPAPGLRNIPWKATREGPLG
jgi:coenzyme PQQ synthesis protein D (PqqD)